MDRGSGLDRRVLLTGAAAMFTGAATTKDIELHEPPLFDKGLLMNNQLAGFFKKAPAGMTWPNIQLMTQDRKLTKLDQYRGKALVVSLWAEWCVPCVAEMPGMAILQHQAVNDRFDLLSILTGTNLDAPADAADTIKKMGISSMRVFMDGSADKRRLLDDLATTKEAPHGVLPCNLLIDGQGRIRGRSIGGELVTGPDGKDYSIWATNIGLQFCQGLAMGALDQLSA